MRASLVRCARDHDRARGRAARGERAEGRLDDRRGLAATALVPFAVGGTFFAGTDDPTKRRDASVGMRSVLAVACVIGFAVPLEVRPSFDLLDQPGERLSFGLLASLAILSSGIGHADTHGAVRRVEPSTWSRRRRPMPSTRSRARRATRRPAGSTPRRLSRSTATTRSARASRCTSDRRRRAGARAADAPPPFARRRFPVPAPVPHERPPREHLLRVDRHDFLTWRVVGLRSTLVE